MEELGFMSQSVDASERSREDGCTLSCVICLDDISESCYISCEEGHAAQRVP